MALHPFVLYLQRSRLPWRRSIQSRPGPEAPSGAQDKPSKVDNKGTNRREGDRVAPDQRQTDGAHFEDAQPGDLGRPPLCLGPRVGVGDTSQDDEAAADAAHDATVHRDTGVRDTL